MQRSMSLKCGPALEPLRMFFKASVKSHKKFGSIHGIPVMDFTTRNELFTTQNEQAFTAQNERASLVILKRSCSEFLSLLPMFEFRAAFRLNRA